MRGERITEDFKPDDDLLTWATDRVPMVNVEAETEKFLNHHLAKGTVMISWRAAWRTWMLNAVTFRGAVHYTADQLELKRLEKEYQVAGFRAPKRTENSVMYRFEFEHWKRRDLPKRDMSMVTELVQAKRA